MTYDFYLKDSATSGPGTWGEGDRYVVGTELKLLFDEVCQLSSCPFDISDFWWDPTSVSTTSLLIYFVDDQSSSLVRQIKPNSPLGGGGTTHISSAGNLSEVYVSAAASDENGDPVACYWDFGDGTIGSNSTTVSKSWNAAGQYVVRCEVSVWRLKQFFPTQGLRKRIRNLWLL